MQQIKNIQELEKTVNLNGKMIVTKNDKSNIILLSIEEYKKKLQSNV